MGLNCWLRLYQKFYSVNTLGCSVVKFWPNIFSIKASYQALGQAYKFVLRRKKFHRIGPKSLCLSRISLNVQLLFCEPKNKLYIFSFLNWEKKQGCAILPLLLAIWCLTPKFKRTSNSIYSVDTFGINQKIIQLYHLSAILIYI